MTTLLDAQTYTNITGDAPGDDFAALYERAVNRLGAAIGQPIEDHFHTEELRVWEDGWAYPTRGPITSAEDGDDELTHDGIRIQTYRRGRGERYPLTYSAGWTDETIPEQVVEALAWAVHTFKNPSHDLGPVGSIPSNVTALMVAGEFQVSLSGGHVVAADGLAVPAKWGAYADLGGKALLLVTPYRRKGRVA